MDHIKQFEPFFGEWYAESFIGAGSFGRVYKIYKESFGRRFYSALKYIPVPADSSETVQHRLRDMDKASIATYYEATAKGISDEIELMYRLRGNTNIVSFEDSAILPKNDGIGYDILIRMELLTGLMERMLNSPIDTDEVLKIGADICSALSVCKKQGVIHRDIKPENIFVSESGDYKLGDFGIARQIENTATFTGKKGTYNYMAPEVYKGEKYGSSCDTYSLGLVMYRLLNNGRLPFLPRAPKPIFPDDDEAALTQRMKGDALPPPCNADEKLSDIVLKACAYNPKDRFASAEEMNEALLDYGRGDHSQFVGNFDSTAVEEADSDVTQGIFSETPVDKNSNHDLEANGKTVGVFNDVPLGTGFAAAKQDKTPYQSVMTQQPVNIRKPQVQQKPQKPVATNASEAPKKGSGELQKDTKPEGKKKAGLFIGITAAVITVVMVIVLWPKSKMPQEALTPDSGVTTTTTPTSEPTPTPDPVVEFNTPIFDNVFRRAYNIQGTIYESTILGLDELIIKKYPWLTVITDVTRFKNIKKLTIEHCNVSDISPVGSMTKLIALHLEGNKINDISVLSNLTNLVTLSLAINSVSDISPLQNLTKLETLYCGNNQIVDISALAGLSRLSELHLEKNKINDVSALAELTNLKYLDLTGNPLSNTQITWLREKLPNCKIYW